VDPRAGLDDVEKIHNLIGTRAPTSWSSSPYQVAIPTDTNYAIPADLGCPLSESNLYKLPLVVARVASAYLPTTLDDWHGCLDRTG
jgi:hypothetical protein